MKAEILQGDVRQVLATLPAESVQCAVTSPPYWGLRSYGTDPQTWGGEAGHEHVWKEEAGLRSQTGGQNQGGKWDVATRATYRPCSFPASGYCECGAWRGELGNEPTAGQYLANLVEVFLAVRRVLRQEGRCVVQIGDSTGRGERKNAARYWAD